MAKLIWIGHILLPLEVIKGRLKELQLLCIWTQINIGYHASYSDFRVEAAL